MEESDTINLQIGLFRPGDGIPGVNSGLGHWLLILKLSIVSFACVCVLLHFEFLVLWLRVHYRLGVPLWHLSLNSLIFFPMLVLISAPEYTSIL